MIVKGEYAKLLVEMHEDIFNEWGEDAEVQDPFDVCPYYGFFVYLFRLISSRNVDRSVPS